MGISFDTTWELGDFSPSSIAFPDSLSYGKREIDISSNTTAHRDDGSIPLVVDILDVANEAFVSSVTAMGPGDDYTLSMACNSQLQVLVCTFKETHAELQFWNKEIVTLSLWNNNSLAWRRGTCRPTLDFRTRQQVCCDLEVPSGIEGLGIHVLDAKTGETRHTLLQEYFDVVDCKFVVDSVSLVCFVRDNFFRLFNIRSGDPLSVVNISEL